MRILILGGDGMLGHQLLQSLSLQHEVKVTLRLPLAAYEHYELFNAKNAYEQVDILDLNTVEAVIKHFKPHVVINAVGIIKQRAEAKEQVLSILINALFPHQLAVLCKTYHTRMIHLSTDCVFSGKEGMYTEDSVPDEFSLYGRSKLLGEVTTEPHCVTLRTSIIGLELSRKKSLIEWFLTQSGTINGFKKAIYTGFTTLEMARIIHHVITNDPDLSGLWHVASSPINKYDLLCVLKKKLNKTDVILVPQEEFMCDRSLNGERFQLVTGYQPPSWDVQLSELAEQIKNKMTEKNLSRSKI